MRGRAKVPTGRTFQIIHNATGLSRRFLLIGFILLLAQGTFAAQANGQIVDLATYLPNNVKTYFLSLQTDPDPNPLRYSTDVGIYSGQTWFRWQYAPTPNRYYDVMYWDQLGWASRLHYQSSGENCDLLGNNCQESVYYPSSIVYAPRLVTDSSPASGSGSSLAYHYHYNNLVCSGINYYTWQVLPVHEELTYLPRIVQAAPKIHIRSVQRLQWVTGACPGQTWIEDWFFGTVTISGVNTAVYAQGGAGPYADDPYHWDLLVRSIAP